MFDAWGEFVLFTAIPVAAAEIYGWLKDWQTLIAAGAIVLAVRYWAKASIASSTRTAQTLAQSWRYMAETMLESARHEAPPQPQATPPQRDTPPAFPSRDIKLTQPKDIGARLEALREVIRVALVAIPISNAVLSKMGLKQFRRVTGFSFDDIPVASDDGKRSRLANELQNELAMLRSQVSETVNCQTAWHSLVRINDLARGLREELLSAAGRGPDAVRSQLETDMVFGFDWPMDSGGTMGSNGTSRNDTPQLTNS
jgi:hypothetical protein